MCEVSPLVSDRYTTRGKLLKGEGETSQGIELMSDSRRAKGAFSVGVEIGRSSRKECPRTMYVRVPWFFWSKNLADSAYKRSENEAT